MINLNALTTFVAVVETGSVVSAARQQGYSSAAVSRHIGYLQRRLGVRLFEPSGRSISPTPEGRELAARARELVAEMREFERYSRWFSETRQASSSVGALPARRDR